MTIEEAQKLIKFWQERCERLELENEELREKYRSFYGGYPQNNYPPITTRGTWR